MQIRASRDFRCAVSLLAIVSGTTAAQAQQAPSEVPRSADKGADGTPADARLVADQTVDAPSAAAQNNADAAGLADIVVTAQRRSESLQRAAASITAVDGAELARAQVTDASNLTAVVPDLQASTQSAHTQFYIRGIGSIATSAYAEAAIAFNLNGVYVARPAAFNGQFFDLERVEVLKGPQGTLYGRNATGGAVNLLTRKPDRGEFNGYVSAQYGNYEELLLSGALNVPLGENGGLRVAFQTEDHDGYFRDGTDDAKSRAFRISMRGDLTPDLSVNIVGDYSFLGGRGNGAAFLPLGTTPVRGGLGDPAADALLTSLPINQQFYPGAATPVPQYLANLDVKNGGVSMEVTAHTPIGVLTFLPAYRENHTDNATTSIGFFDFDKTDEYQVSTELRLASDGDSPFKYLFGGYYFKEKSDFSLSIDQAFVGVVQQRGTVDAESAAAFTQLSYEVVDGIRATGGLRYTWERKALDGTTGISPPAVFTSGPGLRPLVIGTAVPSIVTDAERNFSSVTWKAGVEWDVAPRSLLYANVGTGFKAGGFFFSQTDNSFDPEKVTSYVIGSKNRFLDNKLQINLEGFLLKYRDQQLAHLGFVTGLTGPTTGFPTDNVGRSTIYGVEANVEYLLPSDFQVGLFLNYVHARYDSFIYATPDISPLVGAPAGTVAPNTACGYTFNAGSYSVDCSGRALIQTPTWTVSGSLRKTFRLAGGATILAEVRSKYESSRSMDVSFIPFTQVGNNTRTDATITYRSSGDRWSLTGYINNIENDDVVGNVFLNGAYPFIPTATATLRPPRVYGIRAQFNF